MKVTNRLIYFFLKDSKLDGRIIIAGALAVYFLSIGIASLFVDYREYWKALGVPAATEAFSDLKSITVAIKCKQASFTDSAPNPCNSWFAYPKAWLLLAPVWPSEAHILYMVIPVIALFYISILFFLGKININSGIYYALLLCSPPMMLAVERCQPDLLIFLLCSVTIWLMRKKASASWSALIILLAGILKLYPFAALIAFLSDNKKKSLKLTAVILAGALIYIFINRTDIINLNSSLTKNYWSVSVGFLHGCLVFFILLNSYSLFSRIFHYIPYPVIAYTLVLLVAIKAFLSSRKKQLVNFNTDFIFPFRIGALLYTGSFLIGNNYDYKFIVFIFTIPQLLSWLRNTPEIRSITLIALLAILFTCWSFFLSYIMYWVVYTFIEESLNWFIFGYFIFMFFNTLPSWTKGMLGYRKITSPAS